MARELMTSVVGVIKPCPNMLLWESGKLCLRVRLLYVYFTCDLIGSRDGPPSPRRYRRPIVAAAAAADRAACIEEDEEEDIIISIARGRGAGYGAACGARRATADTVDRGAHGARRATAAPGGAVARPATVDGADSADGVASLGYGKRVKRPTDKVRMVGD